MRVTVARASVRFGEQDALTELSAAFSSGTVSCVIGPSGSGKSTLLAAIAGLQQLSSGAITYDGKPLDPRAVQGLYSWVAQSPNLLPARTVLDNVLLGPLSSGHSGARSLLLSRRALVQVGLAERENASARYLSGGESQRVAIARALASERRIILADEPSAGLDAPNTRHLADVFRTLAARATIIVATHDPVLMEATDHVVTLR